MTLRRMPLAALAAVALIVAPAAARAQQQNLTWGLKAGWSYGSVSNSGALPGNVSNRSGSAVGLSATTGGEVGYGFEALYAQRGVESNTPGAARKLDYLDVPLYLRVSPRALPLEPFGYVGPQVSYELSCSSSGTGCGGASRPKFTYAGVAGAGIHLGGISLEGRYIYGLTDLNLSTVTSSKSYQTRSFLVLLGFGR